LTEGKPDLVIAFAGRRGTLDMKMQAQLFGVRLIDLSSETVRAMVAAEYRAHKAA
jgi:hypothetical protein